jgi:hypothetical protein
VADQRPGGDRRRGGGDLGVRNAEEHCVGTGAIGAAAKRATDFEAGDGESFSKGNTETALADDGQAQVDGGVDLGLKVQFSHRRYRSLMALLMTCEVRPGVR